TPARSLRETARPPQEATGALRRRVLTSVTHRSIDDDAFDATRRLRRMLERGEVGNGQRVEHGDVGVVSLAQLSALFEPETACRQTRHLVHGDLEREQRQISRV